MSKNFKHLIIMVAFVSSESNSYPMIKETVEHDAFIVRAENKAPEYYLCLIDYTLFYMSFGKKGQQNFRHHYEIFPNSDGITFYRPTTWQQVRASVKLNYCSSAPAPTLPSIPNRAPPDGKTQYFACPQGLVFIGSDYGEKEQGSSALWKLGRVIFPENFRIDDSYHQSQAVRNRGGGANTPWDGIYGIPPGIHIAGDGGHYWALGVKITPIAVPGYPYLHKNGDKQYLTLGMYCGPAGFPGPGCNVKFQVCAKEQKWYRSSGSTP